MKKLILLLFVLVGCSSSDATFMLTSQTAAPTACATAGCDGTYKFCWTGDHAAGDTVACVNSGVATVTGTQSGGTIAEVNGSTGKCFERTGSNQWITWVVSGDDLLDDAIGTMWMSVWTASAPDENNVIFESYVLDGAVHNSIKIELRLTTSRIRGAYRGNSASQDVENATAVANSTWTRASYTWNDAGDVHAVKTGAADWLQQGEALTTPTLALNDVTVGENATGGGETHTIDVDNVYITAGYQDADPYSP